MITASAFMACGGGTTGNTHPPTVDGGALVATDAGAAAPEANAETVQGAALRLLLSATEPVVVEEGGEHALPLTLSAATKVSAVVDVRLSSSLADVTFEPPVVRFGPMLPERVSVKLAVKSDDRATGDRVAHVRATNAVLTSELSAFHDGVLDVDVYDDDTPGIRVRLSTPATTYEDPSAAPAVLQVRLASAPLGDVMLPIAVSDASEAKVSVTSLTFGVANWRKPQEVVVHGLRDGRVDGDVEYAVEAGPPDQADARYAPLAAVSVRLTNVDEDQNQLRVLGIDRADELGSGGFVRVSLAARPMSPVFVPVRAADDKLAVECGDLALDETNWQEGVKCAVHGVSSDPRRIGTEVTSVVFGPTRSADPRARDLTATDSLVYEHVDMPWRLARWSAVDSAVESVSADARFLVSNNRSVFTLLDRVNGTRTQLPLPPGVTTTTARSGGVSNDGRLVALAGTTDDHRFTAWTFEPATGATRTLALGADGLSGETYVRGMAADGHSLLLLSAAPELMGATAEGATVVRGAFWLDLRTPGAQPLRADPRGPENVTGLNIGAVAMSGSGDVVVADDLVFDATTGRTSALGCRLASGDHRRVDHEGRRVLCASKQLLDRTTGALSVLFPAGAVAPLTMVVSAQASAWLGYSFTELSSGLTAPAPVTRYPSPYGILAATPLWIADDGTRVLLEFIGRDSLRWVAELEAR